jgi:hypothetical protein
VLRDRGDLDQHQPAPLVPRRNLPGGMEDMGLIQGDPCRKVEKKKTVEVRLGGVWEGGICTVLYYVQICKVHCLMDDG